MKLQKYLAEVLGTFALALGVWLSVGFTMPAATPVIAGLTLGLFVYTIGHISGAHLNPAVTVGLWSVKKIDAKDAALYIISQFVGAVLAMVFGRIITGEIVRVSTTNVPMVGVAEAVGAFVLVFGIASVVYKRVSSGHAGFVIGGSLLLGIYLASVLSNGVLNPAIALAIGSFNVMYVAGPLLGGILGAQAYKYLSEV
ncbi:MAG: aquaporin [Patescibacteria group bacterium]